MEVALRLWSQPNFGVITRMPFILPRILYSMNELSILRLTATSFVKKIQLGLIFTGYVKTGEQLGDIFTKVLNGDRVSYLCDKLGMIDIYAPT